MLLSPWIQKKGSLEPFVWTGTREDQGQGHFSPRRILANCAIVGERTRMAGGIDLPESLSTCVINCTPRRESPPKSKKLSFTPIGLMPRISSQILVSCSSKGSWVAT